MATLKDRIPDEIKLRLLHKVIMDFNGDYRKSVFLSGTGRGGTTWVSAVMNYDNRYRDMFEPFHSHFVRDSRRFIYPLYLRPNNKNSNYIRAAKRILTGQVQHWWVDQYNRRLIVNRRLIKEVRANLWLKWLKINFPELPVILLFRHPCAVADSRMILEWPTRLQQFFTQTELMEDHLQNFREVMTSAKTPFERHILVWCIQYYVPLRQFAPDEIHLAFYENFLAEPEEEVGRLFGFLGQKFDDRIGKVLGRPSKTTRSDSDVRAGIKSSLIDSWRKRISKADVQRAVEILTMFGLHTIYGEDSLPSIEGAQTVLARNALMHPKA